MGTLHELFAGRDELSLERRAHLIQALTDRVLEREDLRVELALRDSEIDRIRSLLGEAAPESEDNPA